jgi:hypothetical protein
MLFGSISAQRSGAAPPAGRTINVGTGSGMLTIDGQNLTYEGSPTTAQAGDTIVVAPGTYQSTQWPLGAINIQGFNLPSGFCRIIPGGKITLQQELDLRGADLKGVDLDFRDNPLTFGGNAEKIRLDPTGEGGYERIKIRGFTTEDIASASNGYVIRHMAKDLAYDNGTGKIAIKDLEISHITITGDWFKPIVIGNDEELVSYGDSGYCENVHIHNINSPQGSCGSHIIVGNCQGYLIENCLFTDINPLSGAIYHWRMIFAKGWGVIRNCRSVNSGGAIAVQEMYSRNSGDTCKMYNIAQYNSQRYSAVEFRSYSNYHISGVTFPCTPEANFVGAWFIDSTGVYNSSCIDAYGTSTVSVIAKNCFAVNPQNIAGLVNEGTLHASSSNNTVVADNSATLLEAETMIPASGSSLKGAGVAIEEISQDLYGATRPSPPTIGAVEAL